MLSSGLLVISLPLSQIVSKVGRYLKQATRFVDKVVYVKLEPCLSASSTAIDGLDASKAASFKLDLRSVVPGIYREANRSSPSIDVRVLVNPSNGRLQHPPETLLTNCSLYDDLFWKKYAALHFDLKDLKAVKVLEDKDVANEEEGADPADKSPPISYHRVCLGGTFDSLHNGHKVLLSEALLRTTESLTVGVTDVGMIKGKKLWELIEPVEKRITDVQKFLEDVDASVKYTVVPISDPFGPAVEDLTLECILVSQESLKGGNKVNEKRAERGMQPLDVVVINLLGECCKQSDHEEDKVSSSSLRIRKLGTLLRDPEPRPNLPLKPYLIGLTGGIASGKTHICQELEKHGAGVINCDQLAHESYLKPDSIAYSKIIEAFGDQVVNKSDSTIDRQLLGAIVFNDQHKLKKLNGIVWPATQALVAQKIDHLKKKHQVIVIEAALLLEAHWNTSVHQVWVAVVPEEEAIKRLQERNKMTADEAKLRISTQFSNYERIKHAQVVFCSLWEYEFTHQQVHKAWQMLREKFLDK